MSFIYLITKGFEDSFTCGCDTTDSVRYHLRANKIDLSLKIVCPFWPRRLGARVGGAADDAAPTRGAFAFRGELGGELACRLRCPLAR